MREIVISQKGFTLAEIIITLGIIGVVAAMTIPALSTNIRRKTASARLKTFYSTMKQMLLTAENEQGDSGYWNTRLSHAEFWDTYFLPYIKASKGKNGDKIYFNDGSSLNIFGHGDCLELEYDYNGDQGPNIWAHDKFWFVICSEATSSGAKSWCPEGFCARRLDADKNNRPKLYQDCKRNRQLCGALLEYDHWEFLPDYPW